MPGTPINEMNPQSILFFSQNNFNISDSSPKSGMVYKSVFRQ